jgi:anti-sigma regulatory factor (Ser/Thr protein kinase)
VTGSRAHRSYLELAAEPESVPYARRHTRRTLAAWNLDHLANPAETVVSEIMTNAIAATRATAADAPIALYLALAEHRLFVLAWDASPDLPVHREPGGDAETGRGLVIVQALASQWGTCVPVNGGKVTWARFNLAEEK